MIQCFECEDWFHNTHLTPREESTSIDDNYFLVCSNCIKAKDGYKEALMNYKQFFFKRNEEQVGEPAAKRQKISENEEKNVLLEPLENKDDFAEDIIIDDAFLKSVDNEDHKKIFSRLQKMVDTIQNLDEEQEEINQNLHGEVVSRNGSPLKDK